MTQQLQTTTFLHWGLSQPSFTLSIRSSVVKGGSVGDGATSSMTVWRHPEEASALPGNEVFCICFLAACPVGNCYSPQASAGPIWLHALGQWTTYPILGLANLWPVQFLLRVLGLPGCPHFYSYSKNRISVLLLFVCPPPHLWHAQFIRAAVQSPGLMMTSQSL